MFDDQQLRSVDLKAVLKAAGDKQMSIDLNWTQPITNISADFK